MFGLKFTRMLVFSCFFVISINQSTYALEMPRIFASHMVFQRDMSVNVWGKAKPGATVSITFVSQKIDTRTDSQGRWQAQLSAMSANTQPQILTVTSDKKILKYEDILVGEVWLCSGQSNMEWPMRRLAHAKQVMDAATDPMIRLAGVARNFAQEPQSDTKVVWLVNSPKNVANFTAVGYYFGKYLREKLNVPIGLIRAAWGGTPAEAWTSQHIIDTNPNLKSVKDLWQWQIKQYPKRLARYEAENIKVTEKREQWLIDHPEKTQKDAKQKFRRSRKPYLPDKSPFAPSVLYNGMIHPLAPFTMRGIIWYQGESNAGRPDEYRHLLPALIGNWRALWGQGNLPFGIVQLANFRSVTDHTKAPVRTSWPYLRDAQRHTHNIIPNTGLVTIIDIGEANSIHPLNKADVGKRLCLWALHDVYQKEIACSGPVYHDHHIKNSKVMITFDHVGDGLKVTNDQPLTEFFIAAKDKQWHWAKAKITGPNTIEVFSENVSLPVAVRYAWSNNPANPNLTNTSGLPASPFRTDDWLFGH